jgi:hypothetical protein
LCSKTITVSLLKIYSKQDIDILKFIGYYLTYMDSNSSKPQTKTTAAAAAAAANAKNHS